MTDIDLKITLKADASGLTGALRLSRKDLERLAAGARKAEKSMTRFGRASNRARAALKGMRVDLLSLRGALTGAGFGLVAADIFRAGAAMEALDNGFKAATGSAEGAARELGFVRAESERIGINFTQSAKSFLQLSAAAKGTALQGKGARDVFTAVAEASRVMGLTTEQTSGALTAINQIMSKGTVAAEELRGQLGERLPGAFQIAARAMGVTTQALGKMLEQGEVIADDFLPRFAKELKKSVADGLDEAVDSAQASLARFQNATDEFKVSVAEGGLLDGISSALKVLTTGLLAVRGVFIAFFAQVAKGGAFLENRWGQLTLVLEATWNGAINTMSEAWAGFLDLIARGLDAVGADETAASLLAFSNTFKPTLGAAENFEFELQQLNAAYKEQIQLLDDVASEMINEEIAARSLSSVLPPLVEGKADLNKKTKAQAEVEKAAANALAKSRATLDSVLQGLNQQSAAIGKSETAMLSYRLTTGDLASDLNRLGSEGKQLVTDLLTASDQLAAANLFEDTLTQADLLTRKMAEVQRLFESGAFGDANNAEAFDKFSRVMFKVQSEFDAMGEKAEETSTTIDQFFVKAARNIQSTLGDSLFATFSGTARDLKQLWKDTLVRMASDAIAANLAKTLFGDFGTTGKIGGAAGGIFSFIAGLFHDGGVVGQNSTAVRQVPALAFAGAPRFHNGGVPGLASNEVPIIAQTGEEVLSRRDPRNVLNGGQQGEGERTLHVIHSLESGDGELTMREAFESILADELATA